MYNIDFIRLITDLLPSFMKKTVIVAWLKSLLKPVQILYSEFITFETEKMYEATYSGQVAELEFILNDYYYNDGTLRTIYIDDSIENEEIYIYQQSELQNETYIYNTAENEVDSIIYNSDEAGVSFNFIVYVPIGLIFDRDYLRSLVTKYKIAGPTFTIKTY